MVFLEIFVIWRISSQGIQWAVWPILHKILYFVPTARNIFEYFIFLIFYFKTRVFIRKLNSSGGFLWYRDGSFCGARGSYRKRWGISMRKPYQAKWWFIETSNLTISPLLLRWWCVPYCVPYAVASRSRFSSRSIVPYCVAIQSHFVVWCPVTRPISTYVILSSRLVPFCSIYPVLFRLPREKLRTIWKLISLLFVLSEIVPKESRYTFCLPLPALYSLFFSSLVLETHLRLDP